MQSDMTLHRLTGEGGELLSAQLQRVAEQQQDIDFGADMMDFDPIEGDPQQPRPLLVLTPPKAVSRKRVLPKIKPDARIELSDAVWKRQRMDLSFMVVKRPPLPLVDENGMVVSNDVIAPVCLAEEGEG